MAKINIPFNDKNYSVDESALSAASAALKSHLQTSMNGSGAVINLDGVSYNVDSTKLSAATNAFVSHLGTIVGNGCKVVVNGVEYSVDSEKVASTIAELHTAFGNLGNSTPDNPSVDGKLEGDGGEYYTLAPSTLTFRSTEPMVEFQEIEVNGRAIDSSNYTIEEGSTIVTLSIDYLKTLPDGDYSIDVVSENNTVGGGFSVVEPELNEHNFYYNQPYTAYVDMFGENESFFIRNDGTLDIIGTPSGEISTATYTCEGSTIIVNSTIAGQLSGTISADGTEIYCNELGISFKIGDKSIVADNEYIYVYKENLGGYEVKRINHDKILIGVIKSNINGIPTVKLEDEMFSTDRYINSLSIIPNSIIIIGYRTFSSCNNLKNVIIHYGVKSIESQAFAYCYNLENIVIPQSVTNIGEHVFYSCSNLNITFDGTVAQWNAIEKHEKWDEGSSIAEVTCSDGTVNLA